MAESVQEAIEKAKDGKEKAALCIAGLWLYACVTEKLVEDDEPLILPSDSESSDEEIVEEGEATCCFGMLAVVPEDERDWRLLGGLVEVPEDLREFDRDGRILAIQESNVVLVVILALTFADLAVTALATYPQGAPILAGNCPMIEREGDGPVDAGGNALKGWDYNGDGACCDEEDGFLEPGTCGTGKGHGKVLDTPHDDPSPEKIFEIGGVGKTCYQCFNMTADWKTAYKNEGAVEEPVVRRLSDGRVDVVTWSHEDAIAATTSRSLQDVCYDDLTTLDSFRGDCAWYVKNPTRCGEFDDDDFSANIQCCACGGGSDTSPPTPVPTLISIWKGYDKYGDPPYLFCTGGPPFYTQNGINYNLGNDLPITKMLDASPRNSGAPQATDEWDLTPGCSVQVFGNVVLAIFCVEIFLRLRQFSICRSYFQFFTDPFCILDFSLVAIDLIVLLITLALAGVEEKYPWMKPISDFAKSGRIMRAMRIFRMMRAVRAARAVAKLSANMDIFDAAAAGNLAMIAKKVSGKGKVDDDEELDPGTVRCPSHRL